MELTLHAVAASTSVQRRLEDLALGEDDRDIADFLFADGFTHIFDSGSDIVAMGAAAIAQSLAGTALQPGDIDAVVFSTESFGVGATTLQAGRASTSLREALLAAIFDAGLTRAQPYGNWMSACANLTSALAMAQSLVQAGRHSNVMCVTADRVAGGESRLLSNGSGVLSDAAAAFIIGRERAGFRVNHSLSHVAGRAFLAQAGADRRAGPLATMAAFREFAEQVRATAGPLESYDVLLVDGLSTPFLDLILSAFDLKPGSVPALVRPTWGHAFAADSLLGLCGLQHSLPSGAAVGILNMGPTVYGFTALERI
jgi:hypothetical protein